MTLSERFWPGVDRRGADECWPFIGSHQVKLDGVTQAKRRVAWIVTNGPIPKGKAVLEWCGSGACCNPAHLFLGTRKDMGAQKVARGRSTAGEKCHFAKATEEQARYIKQHYRKTAKRMGNGRELARQMGLSAQTVNAIGNGRTWKHVS